jgi:hypothetical protein
VIECQRIVGEIGRGEARVELGAAVRVQDLVCGLRVVVRVDEVVMMRMRMKMVEWS